MSEPVEQVSAGFVASNVRDTHEFVFADHAEGTGLQIPRDQHLFARRPDFDGEDDIAASGAKLRMKDRDQGIMAELRVNAAFVAKCVAQITGYHLMIEDVKPSGEIVVEARDYDPKNRGNCRANTKVYEMLAQCPFRSAIESWLDEIAGRTKDAVADAEDLGNG